MWTGHNVYLTDMNHGYEDVDLPISVQNQPEAPVVIGDGSWLGHGVVVLPGAHIGRHVVIGANSVVTGEIPDFSVAVGAPARVIRVHDAERGWVDPRDTGAGSGSRRAQAVSDRRGLATAGHAQLGQDVRDVDAGRLRADEQLVGDLAVRAPGRHQGQHLALAWAQAR